MQARSARSRLAADVPNTRDKHAGHQDHRHRLGDQDRGMQHHAPQRGVARKEPQPSAHGSAPVVHRNDPGIVRIGRQSQKTAVSEKAAKKAMWASGCQGWPRMSQTAQATAMANPAAAAGAPPARQDHAAVRQ